MLNNAWAKLAVVSLAGIVISLVVLWGINQINYNKSYNYNMNGTMNMQGMPQYGNGNMNDMYRYGMQQWQNWRNNTNGGMSMQGGMNGQGNMNMQGGMMMGR